MAASDIRAGRSFVELLTKDVSFSKGIARAQKRLNKFSSSVFNIGKKLATTSIIAVAPFIAAAKVFASVGDNLQKMSIRTGIAVEELSKMEFATSQAGTSLAVFEKAIQGMQRNLLDASRGLATAKDNLDDLGVAFKDIENLTPEQQFLIFVDRISKIEGRSKKAALALKIFGRAGAQLLPLMQNGVKGIKALTDEAVKLGIVLTKEEADAAAVFTDQLDKMNRVLKAVFIQIGSAVAPVFQDLADNIRDTVKPAILFIKTNQALIVVILKVIAAVGAAGIALIAVAATIKIISITLGLLILPMNIIIGLFALLKLAVFALASPFGIFIAILATSTVAILAFTNVGSRALEFLQTRFKALANVAGVAFKAIARALKAGDISLAGEILFVSLKLIFFEGTKSLFDIWTNFKSDIVNVAVTLAVTLSKIFVEMWAGIQIIFAKGTGLVEGVISEFARTQKQLLTGDLEAGILGTTPEQATDEINAAIDKQGEILEKQKREIDKTRKEADKTIAALNKFRDEVITGTAEDRRESLQKTNERIQNLREDLKKLVGQSKDFEININEGVGKKQNFEKLLAGLSEQTGPEVRQKVLQAQSTFNAAAIGTLAGGALNAQQETAINTKKALAFLREIAEKVGLGGVFG